MPKLSVKEKRDIAEIKTKLAIFFSIVLCGLLFCFFSESGQTLNPFDGM